MFFKIVLFVPVVIVALLVIAATKPNSFRVQRSIAIHASPERVFSYINDLHSWETWSGDSGSEPSFSRAFKRVMGATPGSFRTPKFPS